MIYIYMYNYTIYCYQLTQTNQTRLFYFAGGFLAPHLPRQVEVEDWNKVRQGGHPSIDLAHVAPEAATKTRHVDVSKNRGFYPKMDGEKKGKAY